jgi:hypothetical protein
VPADNFNTFNNSSASGDQHAALKFWLRRSLAQMRVASIVRIKTVYNSGGVAASGIVDVQPLVQQIDGQGNVYALPVIFGVPYSRLQGGTNAVILDPQVGDIGWCIFGDRDQSAAIASKGLSIPGSDRRHSLSDAMYVGTGLTGVPTQYVQFSSAGVDIVSPTAVKATVDGCSFTLNASEFVASAGGSSMTINASGIAFVGPVTGNETATFTGEVEGNNIKLSVLQVSGVQTGSDISGPPVPGT